MSSPTPPAPTGARTVIVVNDMSCGNCVEHGTA